MSTDATTAYFDDVIARAVAAAVVPREIWAGAQSNKCHPNCEAFAHFDSFEGC